MANTPKITIAPKNFVIAILVFIGIAIMLYLGASLLLPLLVAALFATALNGPTEKLKNLGLPKGVAITIVMILLISLFSIIFIIISWQINIIVSDWAEIQNKASQKITELNQWFSKSFGINPFRYLSESDFTNKKMRSFATGMLGSAMTFASQALITLIYIILFLLQKEMFHNFFKKLVRKEEEATICVMLEESSSIVNKYLIGKGKIMLILFVAYYIGFLLGSVPYALFLAIFAALFSIIPYIGNLIGGGAAMILAYLYSGAFAGIMVFVVVSVAQFVESYLLTPWIVGDEIDLNPFMTIFGVIVFSSLWGAPGAIVALPTVGTMKVLFKHIKGLEPYAFLFEKHS
ncbi:AI-2E family transporter [Aureispira sp. CCB-QB1]|uniref:AI-2E family transporter n=1 Tax=Aureispira sp. CCB-QB1 TaxID=1313421 RepID=UPI0006973408|nr:AI-2E family transporter [Aureispira sp. CCB-QB1]